MPVGYSATSRMLSPALNPGFAKCSKLQKRKKQFADGCRRAEDTALPWPCPASTEAARRPTPPPSPRRPPLLPRAPRPRSAWLSASGRPCAAALTRVTSGPAPRADRRAGGGTRRGPAHPPRPFRPPRCRLFIVVARSDFSGPCRAGGCKWTGAATSGTST